jgi:tRNA A37 threonylcarbamoyladenosine synthetase subunit TsaC/SUA5/YrdC
VPLTGTSANLSGGPEGHSVDAVLETFGDALELAIDGGATPGGVPSTLLDTTTRPFSILRAGAISTEKLREVLKAEFGAWMPDG